jgi:hypothetical protein
VSFVLAVAVAVAAAAVALAVNLVLLDYATPRTDRVGRLNPNYVLVRPAPTPARPPRPNPQRELPDD